MRRPTSVTVIGWILIVMGCISLITSILSLNNPMAAELMAKNPLPIPVQYLLLYAGVLTTVVSGIAMLKAQNWARLLYVVWSAIGLVIVLATSPMKAAMIPGFVGFVVITFFLFRQKANEYFSPTGSRKIAQGV